MTGGSFLLLEIKYIYIKKVHVHGSLPRDALQPIGSRGAS